MGLFTVQSQKGLCGRIPKVDLSAGKISSGEITENDKEIFVGGRGLGLKSLWERLKPGMKWNDPEVPIMQFSGGPICGITQYPGTGKSLVVSLSPMTGVPIDSNVGGHFGPLLKMGLMGCS